MSTVSRKSGKLQEGVDVREKIAVMINIASRACRWNIKRSRFNERNFNLNRFHFGHIVSLINTRKIFKIEFFPIWNTSTSIFNDSHQSRISFFEISMFTNHKLDSLKRMTIPKNFTRKPPTYTEPNPSTTRHSLPTSNIESFLKHATTRRHIRNAYLTHETNPKRVKTRSRTKRPLIYARFGHRLCTSRLQVVQHLPNSNVA